MKYFVTLAGRTWQVELEGGTVRVDGEPVEARLAPVPGTPLYHLTLGGGASWTIAAEPGGVPEEEEKKEVEGAWVVGVAGERLAVRVVDERTRAIGEMVSDGRGGGSAGKESVVAAPMPGLIVRVEVEAGARVDAGAPLIVVEAMKMQNELRAARSGVVSAVHVAAGQKVEKGTALVTLTHL